MPKTVEGRHRGVFAYIMLARYFAERTQQLLGLSDREILKSALR